MACLSLSVAETRAENFDYRHNVKDEGADGYGIEKAIQHANGEKFRIYFPVGTYRITNDLTIPANAAIEMQGYTAISVATNKVLTINGAYLYADSSFSFTGGGTVTGSVVGVYGCENIAWNDMSGAYYLTCTGPDDGQRFWNVTNHVGGDLYGPLDNLQIKTGAVTTVEILNGTILNEDIADNTISTTKIDNAFMNLITNDFPTVYDAYAFSAHVPHPTGWSGGTPSGATLITIRSGNGGVPGGWNWSNNPITVTDFDYGDVYNTSKGHGPAFVTPTAGWYALEVSFAASVFGATNFIQFGLGWASDTNNDGIIQCECRGDAFTEPQDFKFIDLFSLAAPPYDRGVFSAARTATFEYYFPSNVPVYPVVYYQNWDDRNSSFSVTNAAILNGGKWTFSGHRLFKD